MINAYLNDTRPVLQQFYPSVGVWVDQGSCETEQRFRELATWFQAPCRLVRRTMIDGQMREDVICTQDGPERNSK